MASGGCRPSHLVILPAARSATSVYGGYCRFRRMLTQFGCEEGIIIATNEWSREGGVRVRVRVRERRASGASERGQCRDGGRRAGRSEG